MAINIGYPNNKIKVNQKPLRVDINYFSYNKDTRTFYPCSVTAEKYLRKFIKGIIAQRSDSFAPRFILFNKDTSVEITFHLDQKIKKHATGYRYRFTGANYHLCSTWHVPDTYEEYFLYI
jgi:hypothetical protein